MIKSSNPYERSQALLISASVLLCFLPKSCITFRTEDSMLREDGLGLVDGFRKYCGTGMPKHIPAWSAIVWTLTRRSSEGWCRPSAVDGV